MIACRIGLGLGNSLTSGGLLETVGAIRAKYPQIDCHTYNNGYMDSVIAGIKKLPLATKLIIGGYSWGADNTSIIADKCGRIVNYIFALQPSAYYPTTPLGTNVKEALCVYNPYWFETLGLGFQKLTLADGNNVTQLNLVKTSDSHPSVQYDTRYRQMILDGIGRVVNSN